MTVTWPIITDLHLSIMLCGENSSSRIRTKLSSENFWVRRSPSSGRPRLLLCETTNRLFPFIRKKSKWFVNQNIQTWDTFFLSNSLVTFPWISIRQIISWFSMLQSCSKVLTYRFNRRSFLQGQSRVLVILNDPLRPEDNVTVIVDRCGEAIEITHVKRRNAYVLQFSIPDRCLEVSMLVGVRIMINGCPQGVKQVKCESRLRELDQILRAHDNPLEFMCQVNGRFLELDRLNIFPIEPKFSDSFKQRISTCFKVVIEFTQFIDFWLIFIPQTFGFNPGDREQLDNWMVNAFQKNLPPRFDLLSTPSGAAPLQRNHTSESHF